MTLLPSTVELVGLAHSAVSTLCSAPVTDASTAEALACGVVDLIVRSAAGLSSEHHASNTAAQRLRIERFMRANLSDASLSASVIADAMGVSKRSVYRLFTPDTPVGVHRRFRIERACALLADPRRGDLTINHVAHECGYASLAAFVRAFKRATGLTPSEFRSDTAHPL